MSINNRAEVTALNRSNAHPWNLEAIVQELRDVRSEWRKKLGRKEHALRDLPSRSILEVVLRDLAGVLYPMRLGPHDLRNESTDYYVGSTLAKSFGVLEQQIKLELQGQASEETSNEEAFALAHRKTQQLGEDLPSLRRLLDTDLEVAFQGDPAARSVDEVLLCYPGMQAIIYHRIAHKLFKLGLPLIARIIAEIAHSYTGVDIHPGATIGAGFFIDHGTGVVIGETAIIGERVRLYQAVTLGAKSFPKAEDGSLKKGLRRHPIVEDDVVIYAGATVLGRITVGRNSVIGGNVWVINSVPEGSVVTQANSAQEILLDGQGI